MPAQQLHLFESAKPLLQRFGPDFFRAVPQKPGVYIMSGEAERVLYIGQSQNLRQRLASYKNARPDRVPRKIIRLVHSVKTITWQECESPEAARLKENQLLRTLRPKFNVMNTYPKAYGFIGLKRNETRMEFWLTNEPKNEGNIFGAFKSGCVRAYGTLLRVLWAALHQPSSPHDFPALLIAPKPPRQYALDLNANPVRLEPAHLADAIESFFGGTSDTLIHLLSEALPAQETISSFQRNLQLSDIETLTGFFERGPKRNHHLRQQYELPDHVIPQEELDDLLVARKATKIPESTNETAGYSDVS
ncbi:MAG: Excinuclease subunit domain protein [Pedosphaera sp.]|nr:Excinuclease subunit domain protein [Pedosphaera sp.]